MLLRRSLSLYRVFDAHTHVRFFTSRIPVTVGIRREDPHRIWERRAPLTPQAVHELIQGGVSVELEPCNRRVFRDAEYTAAGATLSPTLTNAHIILGIKEPPIDQVLTSGVPPPPGSYWDYHGHAQVPRTHLMFSHTAKGQPYNTPLLAKYVVPKEFEDAALRPRLVDYELLTDGNGKRTVGFGWFAGVAGVLESLSSMAHSHLEHGIASPFLSTPRPHTHPTLQSIRTALRTIGEQIKQGGIPPALGPFVIGLTGNGNVAHGCLDILQELPIEKVQIKDLHALVTNPQTPLTKIYLAHAMPQDYFVRYDGRPYDRAHYYAHPESYRSVFCETVAPYLTLLLNGTGWSAPYPRLMTKPQLSTALALARARAFRGFRFENVGDISCDIEGGLEFLTRATTLTSPFYKLALPRVPSLLSSSSSSLSSSESSSGSGTGAGTGSGSGLESESELPQVQIMAVDILPAALPLDASEAFSRDVMRYVWGLVWEYWGAGVGRGWGGGVLRGKGGGENGKRGEEGEGKEGEGKQDGKQGEANQEGRERSVQDALERATIARGGELVGRYRELGGGVARFWEGAGVGRGEVEGEKEMIRLLGKTEKDGDGDGDGDGAFEARLSADEGEGEGEVREQQEETEIGVGDGEVGEGVRERERVGEVSDSGREREENEREEENENEWANWEKVLWINNRWKKKVLIIGSGMVARPAIEEISKRGDVQLLVAGNSYAELERLGREFVDVKFKLVNVNDRRGMEALIREAHVVISLLPAPFHVQVARSCLFHRKHLVTASYESPGMQTLHNRAVNADVIFLNEIGLDPGIDHLSALDLISRLKSKGQVIQSFTSFCGGLPAPDVEHTPLRYKFSWNPRGVLVAGLNKAKFLLDNEVQEIPEGALFKNVFPDIPITDEFKMEGLANRDSLAYQESYGLSMARTFARGTLRYPGFSSLMESFRCLGFFNTSDEIYLPNWSSFVPLCIAQQLGLTNKSTTTTTTLPPDAITRLVPLENIPDIHSALEWLGLVTAPYPKYTYTPPPPLPSGPMVPIDIFAYLLAHHLAYKPHERDMVVLSHEIIARDPATQEERVYTSSLVEYGTDRASAMARTVGVPVATAALLVLDGKIGVRGVVRPLHESVYRPVLGALEESGLGMRETVRMVGEGRTVESALKGFGGREGEGKGEGGGERCVQEDAQKDAQIL